jgi:hypothetical protein
MAFYVSLPKSYRGVYQIVIYEHMFKRTEIQWKHFRHVIIRHTLPFKVEL